MIVTPIPALKDNYIWMITATGKPNAVVVDPGDAAPVLAVLKQRQLDLSAILITHHHWDHTDGIKELLNHYPVSVFGPAHDNVALLTKPLKDNANFICPGIDCSFQVLEIPGHTSGHIAYLAEKNVFTGDTLLTAGCGRRFEGTPAQLHNSLQRLAALPESTNVYCGHEYTENNLRFAANVEPLNSDIKQRLSKVQQLRSQNLPTVPSTIGEEKRTNPFLRCQIPDVIKSAEQHAGIKLKNPVEVFSVLRGWKDNF